VKSDPLRQSHAIPGPAGLLEALLEMPRSEPPLALALVCHPHPLHGGTMSNKVVTTLARAFVDLGAATLRFNFRGVEESDGVFDSGRGEVEDAVASADWLRRRWPGTPLILGGFSFGAMIALRASARLSPLGLVTVALPVQRLDPAEPVAADLPWLLIHGAEDDVVALDDVVEWLNRIDSGPELSVVDGAEHFFHGKLAELKGIVMRYFEKIIGPVVPEERIDAEGFTRNIHS
jgi:hypothetical protein